MFVKQIDTNDRSAMIAFLKNHFRYYTSTSMAHVTSYANNIKLTNLGIPQDKMTMAYELCCTDSFPEYDADVYMLINDFDIETGAFVGFNGRSHGYLVLYSHNAPATLGAMDYNADFDDWDDDQLKERVELVCKFDQLCDDLRDNLLRYLEHYVIQEVTVQEPVKHRILEPIEPPVIKINGVGISPADQESDNYFVVAGYDKDNDSLVDLYHVTDLNSASLLGLLLQPLIEKDILRTESGEPFDWLEIHSAKDDRIAYIDSADHVIHYDSETAGPADNPLSQPFHIEIS